jgi:Domain of unknown function (DUF1918)
MPGGVVMSSNTSHRESRPGDRIVVPGHRVGERERSAEVLELLGEPGHERYRVRWDDGHESIFYPGGDAIVRPKTTPRRKKR